jgi:hypothetical protein
LALSFVQFEWITPMRILWIDVSCHAASGNQSSDGIAWLRQRMANMQVGHRATEFIEQAWHPTDHSINLSQRQQLLERIDSGIERIVVASANRLDYPTELIELLQRICPEVPLAFACDSWWDGWRRTGLKSRHHLSLAWYRWWDGWVDWLQGGTPQLYEPIPVEWSLLAEAPRARSLTAQLPLERGLIVGNCRQTLAAWSLAAATAGFSSDCISEQAYRQQVRVTPTGESSSAVPRRVGMGEDSCLDATPTAERRATFTPAWVLWDDSCLDTTPTAKSSSAVPRRICIGRICMGDEDGLDASPTAERRATFPQPENDEIDQFFKQLPTRMSTGLPSLSSKRSDRILGIAAVSLPRADWALPLCSTWGCELLAKPSSGQGLTRLLEHYFST